MIEKTTRYEVTYTTGVVPHREQTDKAATRVEANKLFKERRAQWIYVKLYQIDIKKTELRSSK